MFDIIVHEMSQASQIYRTFLEEQSTKNFPTESHTQRTVSKHNKPREANQRLIDIGKLEFFGFSLVNDLRRESPSEEHYIELLMARPLP